MLLVLFLAVPLAVIVIAAIIALRNGVPEGGIENINRPPRHLRVTLKTIVDEWIDTNGDQPGENENNRR